MKKILVSACLLGEKCRYDGKSKPCDSVIKLSEKFDLVPICPEVFGGLPTPRIPAEIVDGAVLRKDGVDVTNNYKIGAQKALDIAIQNNIKIAVLKEKSPSCGKDIIHNGKFDGELSQGNGITVNLFLKHGINVYKESEVDKLLNDIER